MNRSNAAYKRKRAAFLAEYEVHGGWWACWNCKALTQHPELDHIKRTGMGGSPSLLLDVDNWQILCGVGVNNCHGKKDSGLQYR